MTAGPSAVLDYDELFVRHERARWSPLTDVPPLSQLDHDKLDDDLVDGLVVLARTEFSSIPAITDLLRIFRGDPDVTAWLSIWFGEEVRHHLVLRQWATAAGRDPAGMVPAVRTPDLGAPPPIATLAVNVIGEIRTCWLYAAMAGASREPVLTALLRRIAGDEGRHAQGFAHYARRAVTRDPDRAVPVALRVGQLWTAPDGPLRDANPAAENYQEPPVAADLARLHARYVDRDREQAAVCRLFSDITGLPLRRVDDFSDRLDDLKVARG